LHRNLVNSENSGDLSVHLSDWKVENEAVINPDLEEQMEIAQRFTSMVLGLRKKVNIRVRQPLSKIMIPALDEHIQQQLEHVKNLILTETNVKELEYINEDAGVIVKKIKADFKALGPKYGKLMKSVAAAIAQFDSNQINELQKEGSIAIVLENQTINIEISDVEISTEDIPGWLVANEGSYTVALDVSISNDLLEEGLSRELVNKIQTIRKTSGLEVTDRIDIIVKKHPLLNAAIEKNINYICAETLGDSLKISNDSSILNGIAVEITEEISTDIAITKSNRK